MNKRTAILLIAILLIGTGTRLNVLIQPAYQQGAFFEPDNYIYYSMLMQTIANRNTIPPLDRLSGFPQHLPYGEQPGLIYLPLYLYLITLGFFSPYQIMLMLPLLFGIGGMLMAYLLTKELTANPYIPFVAMLFFAIMPAAVFRTSAGEYRGESFVPVLAMIPLLYLIRIQKKGITTTGIFTFIVLLFLFSEFSIAMWSGGIYVPILYAYLIFLFLLPLIPQFYKIRRVLVPSCLFATIPVLLFILPKTVLHFEGSSILELAKPTISFYIATYGYIGLPLAIFYFIYAFLPKERSLNRALLICIAVFFAISLPFQLTDVRWAELLALPASIFAALGLEKLVRLLTQEKGEALAIMALLLFFLVWQSAISVFGSGLADAQNHQYFQALSWIRNNTAKNATFLTLWDDGSLLEGYANRTSYSDSIQGMNESGSMVLFSRFLFAKAGNFTYISEVQPDYLLVRKVWLNYSTSLLAEGSLPSNTPINGTNIQALTVGFLNSTYLHIVYRNNDSIIYKVKG